jgi:hypothetical protein
MVRITCHAFKVSIKIAVLEGCEERGTEAMLVE